MNRQLLFAVVITVDILLLGYGPNIYCFDIFRPSQNSLLTLKNEIDNLKSQQLQEARELVSASFTSRSTATLHFLLFYPITELSCQKIYLFHKISPTTRPVNDLISRSCFYAILFSNLSLYRIFLVYLTALDARATKKYVDCKTIVQVMYVCMSVTTRVTHLNLMSVYKKLATSVILSLR